MSGAGAGVRACRTGCRGQRGGEGECREALQDPAARLCPAAGTVQPLGFGEGVPPHPESTAEDPWRWLRRGEARGARPEAPL